MKQMASESVEAIVCDPPYGLNFMGSKWDSGAVAFDPATWREALRVLKPGGHLVAFGGTRTFHRLVCAIEDAGFEVRDQLIWSYGSGFPKSLDVSKAIDDELGAVRDVTGKMARPGIKTAASGYQNTDAWSGNRFDVSATEQVKWWEGWGSALKPAYEPICLARRPLKGTIAQNVLRYGVGGLNIQSCRVAHDEECRLMAPSQANISNPSEKCRQAGRREATLELKPEGRWPPNLLHDNSEEVLACFPNTPGQLAAVNGKEPSSKTKNAFGLFNGRKPTLPRGDSGSAARFFPSFQPDEDDLKRIYYTSKASKKDRNAGCYGLQGKRAGVGALRDNGRESMQRFNDHPTVKPTDLLRWLARLICPKNGTILDPFMGSGSTGRAAVLEGFGFIGIELDPDYATIAEKRIREAVNRGGFFKRHSVEVRFGGGTSCHYGSQRQRNLSRRI